MEPNVKNGIRMRSGTGSGLHVRASRPHLLRIWTSGPTCLPTFRAVSKNSAALEDRALARTFRSFYICRPRSATTSRAFDQASAPNRTAVESLIPGNRNIGNSKVCRGKYTIGIPKTSQADSNRRMPMPPRPLPSRRKTGRGKRPNTNRKEREKRSAFRKCPVLSDNGRETERNA